MNIFPSYIFDWLKVKSFAELSSEQQKEVLTYISANEYDELHQASLVGKAIRFDMSQVAVNPIKVDELKNRLKEKKKKTSIINTPISLWQVAASFIVFAIGCYLYLTSRNISPNEKFITVTDTVYIEKNIPAEKVHDTIYILKSNKESNNINNKTSLPNTPFQKSNIDMKTFHYSDLNQLSVSEYDNMTNTKKGQSIKDDSLIQNIGFTTL